MGQTTQFFYKQHLFSSENYSLFSFTLSCKNNRRYSKKCAKANVSILIGSYGYDENEAENKIQIKNKSYWYDMNRPSPRHRHGQTHVKWVKVWWLLCVKQHLSNIWSSTHEKVKQHWGWVQKSVAYKKRVFTA